MSCRSGCGISPGQASCCCSSQPCAGPGACTTSKCCPSPRLNLCSPNPMRPCCYGPRCCKEPTCVPLPMCPKICCPFPCVSQCRKPSPNCCPATILPPHHLCPPRCTRPPPCQKMCVVISRCQCPAKPILADPCCPPRVGPMRLPYVAPPCPIPC